MTKYKRLTTREGQNYASVKSYSSIGSPIFNAINRLAELEDMIEQNVLIKLPCKVGDTVYAVGNKTTIRAEVVTQVRCEITDGKINLFNSCIFTLDANDKDDNVYRFSNLGRKLFLTKAEAEAEVERLNRG